MTFLTDERKQGQGIHQLGADNTFNEFTRNFSFSAVFLLQRKHPKEIRRTGLSNRPLPIALVRIISGFQAKEGNR